MDNPKLIVSLLLIYFFFEKNVIKDDNNNYVSINVCNLRLENRP